MHTSFGLGSCAISSGSDSLRVATTWSMGDGSGAGTVRRSPAAKRGDFVFQRLTCGGIGAVRVRKLGGDRAGELRVGRFLRNARVTPSEMTATAVARTHARVRGRQVVAVQDTTSLRDDGDQRSLHLHPPIAIDLAEGSLIGLLDAQILHRSGGKRARTGRRAFADKESRRWLDATIRASDLPGAGGGGGAMSAGREADIYEEFALRPARMELVIRVQQDRSLSDGRLLSGCLAGVSELGRE